VAEIKKQAMGEAAGIFAAKRIKVEAR